MKVNVDNVPKGLILFDNWCLWKPEQKDGRLTKVPYTFKDNKLIKCDVTNQSNGMAFFDAVEIAENHNCGIGFMFTENGICGVDVDHCIVDGKFTDEAQKIISMFKDTYIELSPSNTGLHIFFADTDIQDFKNRKFNGKEIYVRDRFFTVTGNKIKGCGDNIKDYRGFSKKFVAEFIGSIDTNLTADEQERKQIINSHGGKAKIDDEALLQLFTLGKDVKLKTLFFDGDISGYNNDDSSADMALMIKLAYYTDGNSAQMLSLFDKSKLGEREKWQNRQDYRERTLANALKFYDENKRTKEDANMNNKEVQKPVEQPQQPHVEQPQQSPVKQPQQSPVKQPQQIYQPDPDIIFSASKKIQILQADLEELKKTAPATLTAEMIDELLDSEFDDLTCAKFFCEVYSDVRFNSDTQKWNQYDGVEWKELNDDRPLRSKWNPIAEWAHLQAKINYEKLIFEDNIGLKKHAKFEFTAAKKIVDLTVSIKGRNKKKYILETASELAKIYIKDSQFNSNPYMFNCQNYTLDVKNMKILEHKASDYHTQVANLKIDENLLNILNYDDQKTCKDWDELWAKCAQSKEWNDFIEYAIPNAQTRRYLQKYIGCALLGLVDEREDVAFFLYGQGGTGKTTFIETIKNIFGEYAMAFPIEYLTANGRDITGDEPCPTLYRMRHCRLAISSETKKNRKLDVDKLKRWTGRDTLIARTLFREPIEFKPQFHILMCGNFAPRIEDIYDTGLRRRLRIIPFKHRPKEANTGLEKIFSQPEQKAAIFNWILIGALAYLQDKANGINTFDEKYLPPEVAFELKSYYNDNDNIQTFVEDCNYEINPSKRVRVVKIWQDYLAWCKVNNERAQKRKDFIRNLQLLPSGADGVTVKYTPKGNGIAYSMLENIDVA